MASPSSLAPERAVRRRPALGTNDFVPYYNGAHDDSSYPEDQEDSESPYSGLSNGNVNEVN